MTNTQATTQPFLPRTIAHIQSYLNDSSGNQVTHFLDILRQAQTLYDIRWLKNLVQAAQNIPTPEHALTQWTTYTRGFIALHGDYNLPQARDYFETLYHQQNLPSRLRPSLLFLLGSIYELNEQWDRATQLYQRCLADYQQKNNQFNVATTYNNLAILHRKLEDYQTAVDYNLQSVSILKQNLEDKQWQISLGRAWSGLGRSYQLMGQLDKAHHAFEQYLALSLQWDYRRGRGIALTNLGDVHHLAGRLQQAKACFTLAWFDLLVADNQPTLSKVAYHLGNLELENESYPTALQLFDKAITLAQETRTFETLILAHLSRARTQDALNNPQAAIEDTQQAVDFIESLRANIVSPEYRAQFQAAKIEAYQQLVYRLYQMGEYAEAFRYGEMAKSRVLMELLVNRPIRLPHNVPTDWLTEEEALRRKLTALYQSPTADADTIRQTEEALHTLRGKIRLQDAEFSAFQMVDPMTLTEVVSILPPHTVLIAYVSVGEQLLAFVITAMGDLTITELSLTLTDLQSHFTLVGQTTQLHNLLPAADSRLHFPWALEELYEDLIEPLAPVIQQAQTLCIIPTGLLHHIPFHALYQETEAGPVYLKGTPDAPRHIIYAPSAAILCRYAQQKPKATGSGCLALGFNDRNLANAEAEAAEVVNILGGHSLVGPAATREALLTTAQTYPYLHIASHGWFRADLPLASGLNLADTFVDVPDILQNLQLQAELVTLSACETGRNGISQGDELIGLSRAFLYAGTPALLVSQWVVDDLTTRLFMREFYRHLQQLEAEATPGPRKAIALNRAQHYLRTLTLSELRQALTQLISDSQAVETTLQALIAIAAPTLTNPTNPPPDTCLLAHPFYWAGFFLIGERLEGLTIDD